MLFVQSSNRSVFILEIGSVGFTLNRLQRTNWKYHQQLYRRRRRSIFSWFISSISSFSLLLFMLLIADVQLLVSLTVCVYACVDCRVSVRLDSIRLHGAQHNKWTNSIERVQLMPTENCVVERCQTNGRRLWILYVISHLNDGGGASNRTPTWTAHVQCAIAIEWIDFVFIRGEGMRVEPLQLHRKRNMENRSGLDEMQCMHIAHDANWEEKIFEFFAVINSSDTRLISTFFFSPLLLHVDSFAFNIVCVNWRFINGAAPGCKSTQSHLYTSIDIEVCMNSPGKG